MSGFFFLSIMFGGLFGVLWQMIPSLPLFAFGWLLGTAPVWLPVVLLITAWKIWMWYVHSNYIFKRDTVLLEVKMPREVTRSPRAMENALSKLWTDSGETTFFNTAWQGQVRPYFSLEIVSFGGEIHFYIWCWEKFRSRTEAFIYSPYPQI